MEREGPRAVEAKAPQAHRLHAAVGDVEAAHGGAGGARHEASRRRRRGLRQLARQRQRPGLGAPRRPRAIACSWSARWRVEGCRERREATRAVGRVADRSRLLVRERRPWSERLPAPLSSCARSRSRSPSSVPCLRPTSRSTTSRRGSEARDERTPASSSCARSRSRSRSPNSARCLRPTSRSTTSRRGSEARDAAQRPIAFRPAVRTHASMAALLRSRSSVLSHW